MSDRTLFIRCFFSLIEIVLGNNQCFNVYCASNSSFKYDRKLFQDRNNVAAEVIKLIAEYNSAYLDEFINSNLFLIEENLREILNKCKELNQWDLLRNVIYNVFSNRQNLSCSFLKKGGFHLNLSSNQQTSLASSATPKSNDNSLLYYSKEDDVRCFRYFHS